MHPELVANAAAQGGVFTTQQARARGYTADEIRARLTSGRWTRVRHGIYRCSGEVDEYRVRPSRPELTLDPASKTTSVKGCVVHRELVPESRRTVMDGLSTTDVARTVVDLARSHPFASSIVAADGALGAGLTTKPDLAAAAAGFRGRPSFGRIERVLAFTTDQSASPGESLARTVFAAQGLPAPLLARPISVDGVVIAEVDFLWPEHRTIAEFDGGDKYLADNDRGDDVLWQEKLREERLREAGFEVVRMTWAQITRQPEQTAARIRAAFARQAYRSPTGR
jgi:Transcriptional regulator, AbiEi antitoxin